MTDDKLMADLRIPAVRDIFDAAGREFIKRCREDGVAKSQRHPDLSGNLAEEQGA